MANSVDPDQTAPVGAVCSWSTLFAYILISSVMFGNYLQQTTSADDIFRCIFFLGALRVNLTCNMATFRKEDKLTFDPTHGVNGKCESKQIADMLLYASFPLI